MNVTTFSGYVIMIWPGLFFVGDIFYKEVLNNLQIIRKDVG